MKLCNVIKTSVGHKTLLCSTIIWSLIVINHYFENFYRSVKDPYNQLIHAFWRKNVSTKSLMVSCSCLLNKAHSCRRCVPCSRNETRNTLVPGRNLGDMDPDAYHSKWVCDLNLPVHYGDHDKSQNNSIVLSVNCFFCHFYWTVFVKMDKVSCCLWWLSKLGKAGVPEPVPVVLV